MQYDVNTRVKLITDSIRERRDVIAKVIGHDKPYAAWTEDRPVRVPHFVKLDDTGEVRRVIDVDLTYAKYKG